MEAKPQLGGVHNRMGCRTHAQHIAGQGRRVTSVKASVAGREHFLLGRSEAFQRKKGRSLSLGRALKNGERDLTQGPELDLKQVT